MELNKTIEKPRRILIFSLAYYPAIVCGAEIAIKEITDRIASSDVEFDMIAISGGEVKGFEKIGNVNVYKVSNRLGIFQKLIYPFSAFLMALDLHRVNKYDAIWSMMASYAGFAGFLFKKTNSTVPFILTLQEGENFEKREGIFNFIFKNIFKSADRIQAISKFLENWARYMGAKCPIDIVPNGVDIALFSNRKSEGELNELKNKLNKKADDIFLITTSRLVPKNAIGDIIDSMQYLPLNVKFLILGSGYLEKELKEKVKVLNLENRIQFLGYIPHKEMPQYLHISDVFIRPSLSEGMGNSYIEAMASGIPVIATPVGGIVDFLKDGETGLFCEVKNPRSIAQKVEKLIKDKESRDYIVKNTLAMVKEKYDWSIVSNMMFKVFQKSIKNDINIV